MNDIQTSLAGLTLTRPNPERDAPFAYSWFNSEYGRDTLLRMGNTDEQIGIPSLDKEVQTLETFLELEQTNKQLTWMMRIDNKSVGAVWIELLDTEHVKSPAVHIMIGDYSYRGQGIGTASMRAMIAIARDDLMAEYLYSRHLASNAIIIRLNQLLGFENDGLPYKDANGLLFQNIKLRL